MWRHCHLWCPWLSITKPCPISRLDVMSLLVDCILYAINFKHSYILPQFTHFTVKMCSEFQGFHQTTLVFNAYVTSHTAFAGSINQTLASLDVTRWNRCNSDKLCNTWYVMFYLSKWVGGVTPPLGDSALRSWLLLARSLGQSYHLIFVMPCCKCNFDVF